MSKSLGNVYSPKLFLSPAVSDDEAVYVHQKEGKCGFFAADDELRFPPSSFSSSSKSEENNVQISGSSKAGFFCGAQNQTSPNEKSAKKSAVSLKLAFYGADVLRLFCAFSNYAKDICMPTLQSRTTTAAPQTVASTNSQAPTSTTFCATSSAKTPTSTTTAAAPPPTTTTIRTTTTTTTTAIATSVSGGKSAGVAAESVGASTAAALADHFAVASGEANSAASVAFADLKAVVSSSASSQQVSNNSQKSSKRTDCRTLNEDQVFTNKTTSDEGRGRTSCSSSDGNQKKLDCGEKSTSNNRHKSSTRFFSASASGADQAAAAYGRLRNTLRFLLGNLHDFTPEDAVAYERLPFVDRRMLQELRLLTESTRKFYEYFDFSKALRSVMDFILHPLSNFYLEISKDRLYVEARDSFRRRTCQTVFYVLLITLAKMLAPITPHLAEEALLRLPLPLRVHYIRSSSFCNKVKLSTATSDLPFVSVFDSGWPAVLPQLQQQAASETTAAKSDALSACCGENKKWLNFSGSSSVIAAPPAALTTTTFSPSRPASAAAAAAKPFVAEAAALLLPVAGGAPTGATTPSFTKPPPSATSSVEKTTTTAAPSSMSTRATICTAPNSAVAAEEEVAAGGGKLGVGREFLLKKATNRGSPLASETAANALLLPSSAAPAVRANLSTKAALAPAASPAFASDAAPLATTTWCSATRKAAGAATAAGVCTLVPTTQLGKAGQSKCSTSSPCTSKKLLQVQEARNRVPAAETAAAAASFVVEEEDRALWELILRLREGLRLATEKLRPRKHLSSEGRRTETQREMETLCGRPRKEGPAREATSSSSLKSFGLKLHLITGNLLVHKRLARLVHAHPLLGQSNSSTPNFLLKDSVKKSKASSTPVTTSFLRNDYMVKNQQEEILCQDSLPLPLNSLVNKGHSPESFLSPAVDDLRWLLQVADVKLTHLQDPNINTATKQAARNDAEEQRTASVFSLLENARNLSANWLCLPCSDEQLEYEAGKNKRCLSSRERRKELELPDGVLARLIFTADGSIYWNSNNNSSGANSDSSSMSERLSNFVFMFLMAADGRNCKRCWVQSPLVQPTGELSKDSSDLCPRCTAVLRNL